MEHISKKSMDEKSKLGPDVIKFPASISSEDTIRILSGEEEYENVRAERNKARDEYMKNGSRGAIGLVKSLDKVLENYERSRDIKVSQND